MFQRRRSWLSFTVTMYLAILRRSSVSFQHHAVVVSSRQRTFRTSRLILRDIEVDDQGRRIRRQSFDWENNNNDGGGAGGGWDDFDPTVSGRPPSPSRSSVSQSSSRSSSGRPPSTSRSSVSQGSSRSSYNTGSGSRSSSKPGPSKWSKQRNRSGTSTDESDERKINMKALENAGFVHLYGLTSVRNALQANRRDFTRPEDRIDLDQLTGEDYEHEKRQRERKPEAQFSPWLFVQEPRGQGGRSAEKSMQAEQVLQFAQERGIPVATVDKGVLNTLSGDRPHQGFCLRCGKLDFLPLSRIPHPTTTTTTTTTTMVEEENNNDPDRAAAATKTPAPRLWLVLDEVVDPQNLGALLRSAYFLGGGKSAQQPQQQQQDCRIGVLVCAKNSAPPSPVVSAASAGALELLDVYTTSNLPRTLAAAEQDGFRVIGASSSSVKDSDAPVYDLHDLPSNDNNSPTILVLGSEGHGLRHLVAKSCTSFVRIPGSENAEGVDSLNVSVTGGILLWHLLQQQQQQPPR